MILTLSFDSFRVEVFDDSAFVIDSADSPTQYDIVYNSGGFGHRDFLTTHAIKIFVGDDLYRSAIVTGKAAGASVSQDTALVDDDNLVVTCSELLYSLTIPDLALNWEVEADESSCFSVYKYDKSYITHGELSITRIDKSGCVLWQYLGGNIFVSMQPNIPGFVLNADCIELFDYDGTKHRIDYDGKLLSVKHLDPKENELGGRKKDKKSWRKFW